MVKQYTSLNDVDIEGFELGKTEIWYAKPEDRHEYSFFLWERGTKLGLWKGTLPQNKEQLRKTHNKLGSISLTNKDKIYYYLQGELWSPNGEARTLIKSKNVGHTSMSVGDVIVFRDKNQAWIVGKGFKKLWG